MNRSPKTALAQVLCHPAMGRLLGACFHDRIRCAGLQFDTSSPRIAPSSKAALFWRLYESAEIRYVDKWLSPDLDVIELGSSIGVVSSHIRRRLNPERRLICVEPDSELSKLISVNLRLNRLDHNVDVLNWAVHYGWGGSTVLFSPGHSNTTGCVVGSGAEGTSITVATLSDLLRRYAISAYALVADIEGSEAGILLCDSDALRNCQQVIIELHDTNFGSLPMSADALCARFIELGFLLRARHGPVCVFGRIGGK
jgi:FkbM family methyltransferase